MVHVPMSPSPQFGVEGDSDEKDDDPSASSEGDERTRTERRHKWINRQITFAADTGKVTYVLEVVQSHLQGMNLINFSTALHRIAKLALGCSVQARERIMGQKAMKELQRAVVKYVNMTVGVKKNHGDDVPTLVSTHSSLIDMLQAAGRAGSVTGPVASAFDEAYNHEHLSEMRCLSIICWSCATLRIREESLFDRVASVSSARFGEMKPFELSNMLWAFAKLSLGHALFFDGMAPHLLSRREGQFSPQCLSTIVWAFGTAKVHQAAVFTSIAKELASNANIMAPQGIANTAWAFARVRRQEAPLFRALAEAAVRQSVVWTFKPQELSNTVWAFATVGLTHPLLFERIMEVAINRRSELPPQNVANVLWAYAKLMAPTRSQLFPPLLEVTMGRLQQFKPQEVSAILWAVAREVHSSPTCRRFFLVVPQHFSTRLPEFTSQALACMVEAFTLAEVDGLEFFELMMQESTSRLSSFQPPSLCTLFRGVVLKAQRMPDGYPAHLVHLRTISEHIAGRLGEMQPHNMIHMVQTLKMLSPMQRATNTQHLENSVPIMQVQACKIGAPDIMDIEGSPSTTILDCGSDGLGTCSGGAFSRGRPSGGGATGARTSKRRSKRQGMMGAGPAGDTGAPVHTKRAQRASRSTHHEQGRHGAIGVCRAATSAKDQSASSSATNWEPPPMVALARTLGWMDLGPPYFLSAPGHDGHLTRRVPAESADNTRLHIPNDPQGQPMYVEMPVPADTLEAAPAFALAC
mmetsp:Transcript_86474/g.245209  ORF Transcript_86474/g.245209 Transcript_86474/m.245209 type:complete len:750 (-) Transcript_86474:244-2493(-)